MNDTRVFVSSSVVELANKYFGTIKKREPKSVPPAARAVQILGVYI